MVFGTGSNTYTASGINSAASDAAQAGQLFVVTSDAAGNLATGGVAGAAALADGSVDSEALADGAVTAAKIADGAVTFAKIADGAIGAAKLGLTNTIYLEDTGSDIDNCLDLLDALTGLVGPASVVLGPGIYDCGSNPVVLPAQVSLIGSGQNLTTVTGSVEGFDGFVRLQGDAIGLRGLTVFNDDSGGAGQNFFTVVIGAGFVNTRDWRISDVTAEAMNGSGFAIGILALGHRL